MRNRLTLQALLEELLGSKNVYFQPPTSAKMKYPAIRYKLSDIDNSHANNGVYLSQKFYELTLIDQNPDSEFVDKINQLQSARLIRPFVADNLNHWVFRIKY